MANVEELFLRWKTTLSRRYEAGFGAEFIEKAHQNLIRVFHDFMASGCADPIFLKGICSNDANVSAQRLGEMLLYERLYHSGFAPEPSPGGKGPDFCVKAEGKRIWLELITPSAGDDLRINELFMAHDPLNPCPRDATDLRKRTLLRISHGIAEKLAKYEGYLGEGVVGPDDLLVIVVNDAAMCPDTFFYGVQFNADNGVGGQSLAEHAVYGIGHATWELADNNGRNNRKNTSRELVENRPEPKRDGTARDPVPVSLFMNPVTEKAAIIAKRASVISAVLQVTLREDYGVMMIWRDKAEKEDRILEGILNPGVLAINPRSRNTLDLPARGRLMRIVDAPDLSLREVWDLKQREFKMLFGEGYKEQPFPGLS